MAVAHCKVKDPGGGSSREYSLTRVVLEATTFSSRPGPTKQPVGLSAGINSVQFSCSVMSDCDPMDCSMPSFSGHLQLPELAQTHVHRVSDAIQPSQPLSSPSPAFNLSQVFSNESVFHISSWLISNKELSSKNDVG